MDDGATDPLTEIVGYEELPADDGEEAGEAIVLAGPFGGMTPMEASLKGVEARKQKAFERARDAQLRREGSQLKIKNAPSRDVLKGAAAAVLFEVAEKILHGDIPINTAREAASVADTFFNILRLESGQSTANVEHLSHEEKMAAIAEMRKAAEDRRALPIAP